MALLCACAVIKPADAQAPYPNKPIRVVIPFGPGGFADITMRLVGQKLSERTGQQVVIENRPSAGGVIAAAAVTSAPPDGYTLFVLSSGIALSKSLLKTMPFDPVDRFRADLEHGAVRPAAAGEGRIRRCARSRTCWRTARANPGQLQHRHDQSRQHAERHRRAAALGDRHSHDHRAASQHRRGADLAAARRHPDRRRILRRAEGARSTAGRSAPSPPAAARARRCSRTCRRSRRAASTPWSRAGTRWSAPAGTPKEIVAVLNGHVRAIVESAGLQAAHARSRRRAEGQHAGRNSTRG